MDALIHARRLTVWVYFLTNPLKRSTILTTSGIDLWSPFRFFPSSRAVVVAVVELHRDLRTLRMPCLLCSCLSASLWSQVDTQISLTLTTVPVKLDTGNLTSNLIILCYLDYLFAVCECACGESVCNNCHAFQMTDANVITSPTRKQVRNIHFVTA